MPNSTSGWTAHLPRDRGIFSVTPTRTYSHIPWETNVNISFSIDFLFFSLRSYCSIDYGPCARLSWSSGVFCTVPCRRLLTPNMSSRKPSYHLPIASLEGKILSARELQRIQRRTARHGNPTAFRAAVQTALGSEEDLPIPPLKYLPQIGCFACTECHHTLSSEKRALTEHINKEKHTSVPRSRQESIALSHQLDEILLHRGTRGDHIGSVIPHGRLIFPSLDIRLDGLACLQDGCNWVCAPGRTSGNQKNAHRVARRHMNDVHQIFLTSYDSHRKHYVTGLPVHMVQRQKGNRKDYFITAFPPRRKKRPKGKI